MFRITGGKGFHMTFENGNTISIQFGGGNYCENYNIVIGSERGRDISCKDSEIAIWDKDNNWITREVYEILFNEKNYDTVKGYVSTNDIAKIVAYISENEIEVKNYDEDYDDEEE